MTFYITSRPVRAPRHWAQPTEVRTLPVSVRDDGDAFILTAFVPGLKAEDLTIQLHEDILSIEGEYVHHEGEALMSELPAGQFLRALRLPAALDADQADARIENGVLTLRLPKAESARPRLVKVISK